MFEKVLDFLLKNNDDSNQDDGKECLKDSRQVQVEDLCQQVRTSDNEHSNQDESRPRLLEPDKDRVDKERLNAMSRTSEIPTSFRMSIKFISRSECSVQRVIEGSDFHARGMFYITQFQRKYKEGALRMHIATWPGTGFKR